MTTLVTRLFRRRGFREAGVLERPLPALPEYDGYIEQLSEFHVAGWLLDRRHEAERTRFVVKLAGGEEVLAEDRADHFRYGHAAIGIGDGGHGFHVRFTKPISIVDLPRLEVRPVPGGVPLPMAPYATNAYEPIMLISMDIVDNCNLRCPFCFYDYANVHSTNFMDERTIDAALRFLPYVGDGNFWFSCVHEPTLHPEMTRFIDKIPREWRRKVFFTTNLAKRMPRPYFAWLADAGLHHVNISIESMVPKLYERMRKGARFRIFKENWDALVDAIRVHPNPTPIRYIAMVYRSNYKELPGLVGYLLTERYGAHVELRYTFEKPHLDAGFREAEFLNGDEWFWLRDQLAGFRADQVTLIIQPGLLPKEARSSVELAESLIPKGEQRPETTVRHFLPGRYQSSLRWDGTFKVNRFWAHPFEEGVPQEHITEINMRDIDSPEAFLASLPD